MAIGQVAKILILLLVFIGSSLGQATPLTDQIKDLAKINQYHSLEPGFAKGSLGTRFGLGAEEVLTDSYPSESIGSEPGSIQFAHAYFHKGTPWPLDVGVVFSQAIDSDVTKVGSHLQYNVYQGLMMPSLGIRGNWSRTFGLDDAELESIGATAVLDYSLFRFFTVFVTSTIQDSEITLRRSSGFALTQGENQRRHFKSLDQYQTVGLNIRVIPGTADLTAALIRSDKDEHYTFKIAVGL
ncbi:MAG: hypothetical protein HRU19_21320 [Pseudobacteriovorax sp.]|nr:hypothetical protein [Pseudobacteriovorax sp.]